MRGGARRSHARRSSHSALASWLRPSARTATYVERADQFSSRLATAKGRRSTRKAGRQRSRWAFFSNLLRIDDLVRLRPENDPLLHGLHDEVQRDPERGEDDEHGEDPGDVQGEIELENEVAEP